MLIFEREDAQSDAWLWAGRKLAGRGAGHGMSHSNSHSSSHSSASSNSESNHQQLLVRSLQPELVQRKMTETEPNLIVIDRRSPSRTREADALCRWPNSPSNSLVSLCPTNSTIKGTLLDIPTVTVLRAALTKARGEKVPTSISIRLHIIPPKSITYTFWSSLIWLRLYGRLYFYNLVLQYLLSCSFTFEPFSTGNEMLSPTSHVACRASLFDRYPSPCAGIVDEAQRTLSTFRWRSLWFFMFTRTDSIWSRLESNGEWQSSLITFRAQQPDS